MWWLKAFIIFLFALGGAVAGFGIPFLIAISSKNEGAGQALSFFPILTVPLGMLTCIILSIFYVSNIHQITRDNYLELQFVWGYPIVLLGFGGLLAILWMFTYSAHLNSKSTAIAKTYKATIEKDFENQNWEDGFDKLFALASRNGFDVFAAERANINGVLYNMIRKGTDDVSKFPPEALRVFLSHIHVRKSYINVPLMHSKHPDPMKLMGLFKTYLKNQFENLPEHDATRAQFLVDLYEVYKNDGFKYKLPIDLEFISSFPFDHEKQDLPIDHKFGSIDKTYENFGNIMDFFLLRSMWIIHDSDFEPYFKKLFKYLVEQGANPSLKKDSIIKQYDLYRNAGDL